MSSSGFPIHRGLGNWLIKLASEIGWGPGPSAAVLQSLYLGTPLLDQPNGTKNNSLHVQLGQVLDPKDTKRPKTQWPLLRNLEQKQGVGGEEKQDPEHAPCTQQEQRGGQNI